MQPTRRRFLSGAWLVLAAACETASNAPRPESAPATSRAAPAEIAPMLLADLGSHHRSITTSVPAAQRWFDQGLILLYSFNHDEAIRSFREAARLDPDCAMAWWGVAVANGPHINFPVVPPDRAAAAWEALGNARARSAHGNPVEQALIEALATRYAQPQPEDRAPLDQAYATAMRTLWQAHRSDADLGTLAAEALMDLQPWDLWTSDGQPKGNAKEIQAMLEEVLRLDPHHPGAHHLYIHVVEASPDPARGLQSADALRDLVPGASHMVHMPSHIYARVGRWADAALANEHAKAVDQRRRERTSHTGFYQVYMAHNEQFLSFAAMMEGRAAVALAAAHRMVDGIPAEFVAAMGPGIDGFLPIVAHALVRFGRWDEILQLPEFAATLPIANLVRHYARGVALTALGRTDEAAGELAAVDALAAGLDDRPVGNNPGKLVVQIPQKLLAGELAFRQGRTEEGLALLRAAVAVEDQLKYDEPPDWMMPARHPLGAALVQAGQWAEAEAVYRADLQHWPENGWSLFGLQRCLQQLGRADEAAAVQTRFARAWARADVALRSSCFCQPGR